MTAIPGYRECKCLVRSERHAVFAAEREPDRRQVLLKMYPAGEAERARRELALIRRVAGAGIIEPLELDLASEYPLLVLAAPRGRGLAGLAATSLEIGQFLRVAESVCAVIEALHARGIVHRDVRPDSFVVDLESHTAALVDLDLGADARELARSTTAMAWGAPAYMAPEQTGRIRHSMDFRSDLYGLGAMFFELLTSAPPFCAQTVDELLHAQVATAPRSPAEVRPDVPEPVASIVLKLLQKQPEDRYQSARALAADLAECRRQLDATGTIVDFQLGRSDVPGRPVFAQRVVGRDRELALIRDAVARVATGSASEAVWLRGPSGMGKTALCRDLQALVSAHGGYVAGGKFDLNRCDQPDAGIRAAIDSLVQQWLTEDDARLAARRAALRAELGPIARVLVDLAPDLAFVLGDDLPATPALGPRETRGRIRLAVERLLRVTAASAAPLVLVFDDLQWVDAASADVIAFLLSSHSMQGLLVVGTCRVDAGEAADPAPFGALTAQLAPSEVRQQVIDVPPLSTDAVAELLSGALRRPVADTVALADRVSLKTGAVPLLIEQFVLHLHDIGALRLEPGRGWVWDDEAIRSAHIPDGAAALMVAKLRMLDRTSQDVLTVASCISHELSVELLCQRAERDPEDVGSALSRLCDAGLIVPAREAYCFAHDRIREAARDILAGEDRARIHADAARLLLERTPDADLPGRVLEIAQHIQLGAGQLVPAVEARALDLQLQAAREALRRGASATALHYLAGAYARLSEAEWRDEPARAFQLSLLYVECAYQARDWGLARSLVAALAQRPLSRIQEALVAAKQVALATVESDGSAPLVHEVIATIGRFGVRLSEQPSRLRHLFEIARTDWALRGPLGPERFRAAAPSDADWLPPVIVMSAGSVVLGWLRPRLAHLIAARILRVYARHGHRGSPALALAAYAAGHHKLTGVTWMSERYAAAAEKWCREAPDPVYTHRARHTLCSMYYPWTRPRRDLLEPIRAVGEEASELGDLSYAAIAASQYALYTGLVGMHLDDVARACDRLVDRTARSGYPALRAAVEILKRGREGVQVPAPADDGAHTAVSRPWIQASPFLVAALCIIGAHDELLSRFMNVSAHRMLAVAPSSFGMDYLFYQGISASALLETGRNTRALRRRLRSCTRQLRRHARSGSDFEHMWRGLHAEEARAQGRMAAACRRYGAAASLAKRRGYRHHAALFCERHADLLARHRRQTEAAALRRRAVSLYKEWGARAKVYELRALLD